MISYNAVCTGIENSSDLDKILYDGDSLYQNVTNGLKEQERFIHPLLSLDELPHDFEIEIGKFAVEKDPIVSGFLVDTQENSGLPSLHNALRSALSFHQNDRRFSDQSRGFQCTCNALCLISYNAVCTGIENSSDLDKILYDGDSLYQNVTNGLKEQERFIHPLLSLDELPHDFEIEIGKFAVKKILLLAVFW